MICPEALSAAAQEQERADVLAYLARRRDNALAVARTSAEGDELHGLALDRARQLDVVIDEIRAGLHEGVALIEKARGTADAGRQEPGGRHDGPERDGISTAGGDSAEGPEQARDCGGRH